jgi:hypothetical protein
LGASNMISKPMVRFAQTVHLSCVKINTISKWTKTSFQLTLSCVEINTISKCTIGGAQNDFRSYGTFDANQTPILCRG